MNIERKKLPTPVIILLCVISFIFIIIFFEGSMEGFLSATGVSGSLPLFLKMFSA